jgi:hypothetical protein
MLAGGQQSAGRGGGVVHGWGGMGKGGNGPGVRAPVLVGVVDQSADPSAATVSENAWRWAAHN